MLPSHPISTKTKTLSMLFYANKYRPEKCLSERNKSFKSHHKFEITVRYREELLSHFQFVHVFKISLKRKVTVSVYVFIDRAAGSFSKQHP